MDEGWRWWAWVAGAAGCAVVFFGMQPWKEEFCQGWRLVRKYPAIWVLPGLLWGVEVMAEWQGGRALNFPDTAVLRWEAATLTQAWHGLSFGPAAAMSGVLLLVGNVAGLRRGFLKGVESVTAQSGIRWLAVLLAGMGALVADAAMQGKGVPQVWHAAVTLLAVPLMGWLPVTLLAGMLLLAETEVRAPAKVAGVRWLESAAAHGARLWPWIPAHGLCWWLGRWLPGSAGEWAMPLCGVAGVAFCFAPLVSLHVKQVSGTGAGLRAALRLWRTKGWQAVAWMAVSGMGFHLWFLAGKGLETALEETPDWVWRTGAALHRVGHIGLTVMALGAWVALRLAGADPPAKKRRRKPAKTA